MMTKKAIALAALFCLALGLALAFSGDDVSANSSSDKEMATKQGVGESLGTKKFDKEKMPGKMEVGLAIGSIVAMIAVVKFL